MTRYWTVNTRHQMTDNSKIKRIVIIFGYNKL